MQRKVNGCTIYHCVSAVFVKCLKLPLFSLIFLADFADTWWAEKILIEHSSSSVLSWHHLGLLAIVLQLCWVVCCILLAVLKCLLLNVILCWADSCLHNHNVLNIMIIMLYTFLFYNKVIEVATISRVRPIPQFTDTSDTDTFGLLRYRYRVPIPIPELFDNNGRWLMQTSV